MIFAFDLLVLAALIVALAAFHVAHLARDEARSLRSDTDLLAVRLSRLETADDWGRRPAEDASFSLLDD